MVGVAFSHKRLVDAIRAGFSPDRLKDVLEGNLGGLFMQKLKETRLDFMEAHQGVLMKILELYPTGVVNKQPLAKAIQSLSQELLHEAATNLDDQVYGLKTCLMLLKRKKWNLKTGERQPRWMLVLLDMLKADNLPLNKAEKPDSGTVVLKRKLLKRVSNSSSSSNKAHGNHRTGALETIEVASSQELLELHSSPDEPLPTCTPVAAMPLLGCPSGGLLGSSVPVGPMLGGTLVAAEPQCGCPSVAGGPLLGCPPVAATARPYHDWFAGKLARVLPSGQIELANMRCGPNGFQEANFSDGLWLPTEFPNLVFEQGQQLRHRTEATSQEHQKAKGKALGKGKGKAQGKAQGKAKAMPEGRLKAKEVKPVAQESGRRALMTLVLPRPLKGCPLKGGGEISPEQRVMLQPNGCARCRHAAGCTPSCWAARSPAWVAHRLG